MVMFYTYCIIFLWQKCVPLLSHVFSVLLFTSWPLTYIIIFDCGGRDIWGAEWSISHVSIYDMNSSMFVLPIKMSAICIQRKTHQILRNLQQISQKHALDCRSHLICVFPSPFDGQRENGKRKILFHLGAWSLSISVLCNLVEWCWWP